MIYSHVAAGILGAAIAFTGAWQAQNWRYGEQIATMQKDAAEATTKAVKAAMVKTQEDQKRKDDALKEANLRAQKNATAASNANRTVDSLRQQLATERTSLSSISCEASREYSARLSDVFGQCTERLAEMARIADQATSAAITLDQAWPSP